MTSIAQVSNENRTQQGHFWRNAAGTAVATAGGVGAYYATEKIVKSSLKNWATSMKGKANQYNSIFKEPALKTLNANNVKYKDFQSPLDLISDDTVMRYMVERQNNPLEKCSDIIDNVKNKILPEVLLEKKAKKFAKQMNAYSSGSNAASFLDKVFVNFDKMSVAAFHEAGHTKNYLSKFGRVLQTLRHPVIQGATIGLAFVSAVLTPKKTKAEEEDLKQNGSFLEKMVYGFKKNCLAIAAIGVAPKVLEEAMASHKGNKMAKAFLSPEMLKTLKKFNAFALSSYVIKATLIAGSVFAASKIRDVISSKKQSEIV